MKLPIKQFGFIVSLFTLFIVSLLFPLFTYAAFDGGINIGPYTGETQKALSSISPSGWVYLLLQPTQTDKNTLIRLLKEYPDAKFIIRGHTPDNQGSSLTQSYAQNWAAFFTGLPLSGGRVVYFVPINEPNNPNESQNSQGVGGIPSQIVKNYITYLRSAGVFDNSQVRVLSPAMDVFNLADGPDYNSPQNYANQLKGPNGEDFFSQFDGIALNLYGQFNGSQIDLSAPLIKRGLGYREFMTQYLGIPQGTALTTPVFAVETGVLKVNQGIEYEPFANDIATYLNSVSNEWGQDPNFIMYSLFSYDPAINPPYHWIFTNATVLQAMGHVVQYSVTPVPESSEDEPPSSGLIPSLATDSVLGQLYNITKRSNVRLLPQSIQTSIANSSSGSNCVLGLERNGTCLLGAKNNVNSDLAGETEQFQQVYVPEDKIVSAERVCGVDNCVISDFVNNLLGNLIAPQISDKPTGSLNTYRFSGANFSNPEDIDSESDVLAETTNPQKEVVDSYAFTMKMLLPNSLGSKGVVTPTITPLVTQTPTPEISPITTPTPPDSSLASSLHDPRGSRALKTEFIEAGNFFNVPPAVLASVSWIEGNNVWGYTDNQVDEYVQSGVKDPFWTNRSGECRMNACSAAGPMQFTLGTQAAYNYGYSRGDICTGCMGHSKYSPGYLVCIANPLLSLPNAWEGYKNSVKENPLYSNRTPVVCNIRDSFYAAAKKIKTDSRTSQETRVWDKEAVANAGWRYYGQCGRCDQNGDPELSKGGRNAFACNRLGMSYCEYMWKYYQCNQNSTDSNEFNQCVTREGLGIIR